MKPAPLPPPPMRRAVWFAAFLAAGLVVCVVLALRESPPVPRPGPSPLEVHRDHLELREGRWHVTNDPTPFTGHLLETYPDGTRKARTAILLGRVEGLSEGWHTNGQLQVEEHFRAGVSHGPRTKWYPDGQKESEAAIVEGQLHGLFRRWHENGALAEELTLEHGQPHGTSRAYYPSGFLKAEVSHEAGQIARQRYWQDGEHQNNAVSRTP